jgi:hypothetical protein
MTSRRAARATWTRGGSAVLLAGDALALTLFAVLGRHTHDEATGVEALSAVAKTAGPFVIGWLLVALAWLRVRTPDIDATRSVPVETARGWVLAFPVAVLGRALVIGRVSPWSFYVVAFSVPLAFLITWRVVAAVWIRRVADRRAPSRAGRWG